MLESPKEKAKTSSANVFPRSLPQAFQTRRPLIASVDPTFTVGLPFCEIPKVGSWGHPFLVTWATWIFKLLAKKYWKLCSGIGSSSNHHVHLDEFDKSVWGLGAERSDMERVEDDNAILEGSWKTLEALWHQLGGGEKKSSDATRSSFKLMLKIIHNLRFKFEGCPNFIPKYKKEARFLLFRKDRFKIHSQRQQSNIPDNRSMFGSKLPTPKSTLWNVP